MGGLGFRVGKVRKRNHQVISHGHTTQNFLEAGPRRLQRGALPLVGAPGPLLGAFHIKAYRRTGRGLGIEWFGIIRGVYWVAVKELKFSYYIGETLLFTIHVPIMVT